MSANPGQSGENRKEFNQSVVLGAVVGQVGCLTLIIVLAALFGGLWLDRVFGTKPVMTLILMIASIPITIVFMFWIVRKATARLQTKPEQSDLQQGQGGGRQ
jgi:MFS-type transporter involved in bile tolerance (Atg22 family)